MSITVCHLNEGIRLWRENPGIKPDLHGRRSKNQYGGYSGEVGARVAQSLGVPHEQIITLDLPKDTEEEAAAVKRRRLVTPLSCW
ncbi:YdcF family protein [Escherichia coli]|nr:ElyC/SanA/YdcF family protein [Escherichia coli]MCW7275378.1 YdcF family protein [Escherichia coli]